MFLFSQPSEIFDLMNVYYLTRKRHRFISFFSTIARYSFFIHLIQSIALTGINLTRRYTFRGYTFKPQAKNKN